MNMGLCMAIYSVFSRENANAVIEYFSEIERRLSALETWQENHSPVSPFSDDKPSFNGQLVHEALNHINAPIQSSEIRIMPDDMVMVKWNDSDSMVEMPLSSINFSECLASGMKIEYISPILPEQSFEAAESMRQYDHQQERACDAEARVAALEAEYEEAMQFILAVNQPHDYDCAHYVYDKNPCDCGYQKLVDTYLSKRGQG